MRTDRVRRAMLRAAAACALAATAGVAGTAQAQAQAWPERPVRIVLAFPPGGVTDVAARLVGARLEERLRQSFLIDAHGGSGGNIGGDLVAKSRPDGSTFGLATDTLFTVNPLIYRRMPFDPAKDLLPVATLASFAQVLVCHPSVAATNVGELTALSGKQPMTYASGGIGVPGHLAMELLLSRAKATMTHVPYRGAVPASVDVMSHHVDCGFLPGPSVLQHVAAGKLKALAVSSATRSPLAPEVPTVAESGLPGFDASFKLVLFAPAGTPASVVDALAREAGAAVKDPAIAAKLRANDLLPMGDGPEATRRLLQADAQVWTPVIRQIDLRAE